jgi:hypothetical protein
MSNGNSDMDGEQAEEPAGAFANHAVRMSWVLADARIRRATITAELRRAFSAHIETRQTEWIRFDSVSTNVLAQAFLEHPGVVKPITAICNIAGRAIRRDLGFDVETYRPRLTPAQASQLAGYVKPFLPQAMALPGIEAIDDWFYIDKEIRSYQGRWESLITDSLTRRTGKTFKKRKFTIEDSESGEQLEFELDAALPAMGEPIDVAVDVKRIGSPRDIHKRIDEIVNKAAKFKGRYPSGRFGAVVYYPFDPASQSNITNRMRSAHIDGLVFPAGDSPDSVVSAVLLLIPQLGLAVVDDTEPPSLFDQISKSPG